LAATTSSGRGRVPWRQERWRRLVEVGHCTTTVRLTERVSPAAEPAMVSVDVPAGVDEPPPPPPIPVAGMVRLLPQLLSTPRAQIMTSTRASRGVRRRCQKAKGSSKASRIALGPVDERKGRAGRAMAAVLDTAVSSVTMTGVVVPSAPTEGVTEQVELAGAPLQLSATFPESPASELNCSA
jgi:hypothetical protein